jgi:hypothetical protein
MQQYGNPLLVRTHPGHVPANGFRCFCARGLWWKLQNSKKETKKNSDSKSFYPSSQD